MDIDSAELFMRFALERHRIWEQRAKGAEQPWTEDYVLAERKFTNLFRILDTGTQFVVRELLYGPDRPDFRTAALRVFLYRYTNRPEPHVWLRERTGEHVTPELLSSGAVLALLREFRGSGGKVFGPAYKMFSGLENAGTDRLTWAVDLTRRFFTDGPEDIVPQLHDAGDSMERLEVLMTIPRCAEFMAHQINTDLGYAAAVRGDEDEVALIGPGSKVGARIIFPAVTKPGLKEILWTRDLLRAALPAPTLNLPGGVVREVSLADAQNALCEFSKFVRYRSMPPLGGAFKPTTVGLPPSPFYPPHWWQDKEI